MQSPYVEVINNYYTLVYIISEVMTTHTQTLLIGIAQTSSHHKIPCNSVYTMYPNQYSKIACSGFGTTFPVGVHTQNILYVRQRPLSTSCADANKAIATIIPRPFHIHFGRLWLNWSVVYAVFRVFHGKFATAEIIDR